jgi:septal ring factor EnvC (AmiA/AmiB activator)
MEGREMTDLDERTPWQHLANARMTTLEAARKRHAKKISLHGGLLTAMDHDVTNAQLAFRAQLSVLNALRETQNEQAEGLTSVETRLTSVETRLTSVEGTLKKVHVGVDAIQLMLRRMEEKEAGGNPPA